MTEIVKVKKTNQTGTVICYEGAGVYYIKLEDDTEDCFTENELEFVNFKPYSDSKNDVIKKLILMVNSEIKRFECMDIDNENFIAFICTKTGLTREEYVTIMGLND